MPPFGYSPVSPLSEYYATSEYENTIARSKSNVYITSYVQAANDDGFVSPERYILLSRNPLDDVVLNSASELRHKNHRRSNEDTSNENLEWMEEYFSCVCIGSSSHSRNVQDQGRSFPQEGHDANRSRENFIIYPIAKYPERLNSPHLVEKRRRSLSKQMTFQPVRSECE